MTNQTADDLTPESEPGPGGSEQSPSGAAPGQDSTLPDETSQRQAQPDWLGSLMLPGSMLEEPADLVRENQEPAQPASYRTRPRSSPRLPAALIAAAVTIIVAVLCAGLLLGAAYLADALPPAALALLPDTVISPAARDTTMTPDRAAVENTSFASPSDGLIEPTDTRPTLTPAVAVTVLPSPTQLPPSQAAASAIPSRAPPRPTSQPIPTPIPTSSAATATPFVTVREGGGISQHGVLMVYVPGGTFAMGSNAGGSESPVHAVTLSPYYIDQYEVTNASWAACVAAGGCQLPGDTDAFDNTPYYGVEAFNGYPVIYVSWYHADAYCRWRGARLPTEAEWEMAARWNPTTGAVSAYPWGDTWDPARLNYCDAGCLLPDPAFVDPTFMDGWPQMAPVGTFPGGVSALMLYDMAGNVAEWVADWYSPTYYAESPATNPPGPASGTARVVRGGGWSLDRNWTRSTARSHFGALSQVAGIGFRCAVSSAAAAP